MMPATKAIALFTFLLLIGICGLITAQDNAQSCATCNSYNSCGSCNGNCAGPPILETNPGTNMWWRLPGSFENSFLEYGCQLYPRDCPPGCAPSWYVSSELMPLRRDNGRSFNFASLGAGGPTVLRSGDRDFEDDFEAGTRVTVGTELGEWYRLEAVYFGGYDWSDTSAVRNTDANALGGTGNLFSPFSNFGDPAAINGLDFNNFATIRFSSELDNIELNLRRGIAMPPGPVEACLLIGARYMGIKERFNYFATASVPVPQGAINDVGVAADNEMIGIQIGAQFQWQCLDRGWIDFEIKGVLFNNSASQDTIYRNTNEIGVVTTSTGRAKEDTTAYMGDLSLKFNYHFCSAWTFHIGYNALFLTGVALGADNFETDINLLRLGPASLDHRGRVIYHGPSVGLVWTR